MPKPQIIFSFENQQEMKKKINPRSYVQLFQATATLSGHILIHDVYFATSTIHGSSVDTVELIFHPDDSTAVQAYLSLNTNSAGNL